MEQKRRFIAGAKCPKCQLDDKIVLIIEAHHEFIQCVNCDFIEHRPENPVPAPKEQIVVWFPSKTSAKTS